MTKQLYVLFSSTPDREVVVEFTDPELVVLAELMADLSTVRDPKEFQRCWPGHNGCEPYAEGYDEYDEGFSAHESAVLSFAHTHGLETIEIPL